MYGNTGNGMNGTAAAYGGMSNYNALLNNPLGAY